MPEAMHNYTLAPGRHPTLGECNAAGRGPGIGEDGRFREGGLSNTPDERERFVAYMRGHCWDPGTYDPKIRAFDTTFVRCLYGVWRDRGSLPTIKTATRTMLTGEEIVQLVNLTGGRLALPGNGVQAPVGRWVFTDTELMAFAETIASRNLASDEANRYELAAAQRRYQSLRTQLEQVQEQLTRAHQQAAQDLLEAGWRPPEGPGG